MDSEEPTLYHVLKMQKRSKRCRTPLVTHTRPPSDHSNLCSILQCKIDTDRSRNQCCRGNGKKIRKIGPNTCAELAEQPIKPEEIHAALQKGGGNKAPGSDGIGLEFYTTNWKIIKEVRAEILNQMFLQRSITPKQKHGIIIRLPKTNAVETPEGYRPIMLLKSDCKMLARILANRLRQVMEEHLRTSQFCSVPGIAIIEAASIVREAVTHAEVTDTPLCVISLDFRKAFDRNAMTIASQYWRVMV